MPRAPHIEKHFTAGLFVRDVVIGMADGLTVPFALAAGLSGAVQDTKLIVVGGLAEIAAGSIAMGLGGYLAARGDAEHYEQELAREALQRLPADAVVLADGNFGIFAFAYAVQQTQRPMLFRLTAARAGKVLGGNRLRPGKRRKVEWEVSRWDRQTHPGLPAGAVVMDSTWQTPQPTRRKSSPPRMARGVAARAVSRGGAMVPRMN